MIKKQNIRFKSIRNRMLFGFLSVFLTVLVFMGISIYLFTVNMLETRNQESYERILESAENVLINRFSIYEGTARSVLANEVVQKVLQEEENSTEEFMCQSKLNTLESVGRELIYNMSEVAAVYLFDNNGKFYYEDPGKNTRDVKEIVNYDQIQQESWYKAALEAKGKEIFFGYDVISGKSNRISCVKVINRLNSTEKIGLLVINIDQNVMKNVIGQFPVQRDIYVIMNQGRIVYQSGYVEDTFKETVEMILKNKEGKYLITEHQSEEEEWMLVHAVLRSDIFTDAFSVRMIIIGIGIFAVIMVVLLCIFQARQITEPLEQLKKDIQRVGEGKRNFRSTFGDDEVGVIGSAFQNMVTQQLQLKEQVEKEELLRKDSELQLLQSQINPHFLYNTLDTLYWMTLEEGAERSAELTQALSEIFKISLSEGEEFIAVRDEIQFIEDYLYIQNVRFGDKFLVQIQVQNEIKNIRILKQILQPFVENAIYHGLEPKFGKGSLTITGNKKEDYILFQVTDDGVGIAEGVDVMKGYAVFNVHQRIKLHYGEKAELKFDSRSGGGTIVTIQIPLKEVENLENCINR